MSNRLRLRRLHKGLPLLCVIARHSSPLYRKLGDNDMELQKNKVINLRSAIQKLDGLIIPPGRIFSFWDVVGAINRDKGYVEGMLLSNGKVSRGLGGGLCQLSNFLFWIFLHAETVIVERHHHSVDAFPDSGRTLPFGSGATIFHNYLDLKIRNISRQSLQIKLWLTDTCLKGQLLSDRPAPKKFHIFQKNHCFAKKNGRFFRYNEIYRQSFEKGVKVFEERIAVNFAPVAYKVTEEYLEGNHYQIYDLDSNQ